MKFERSNHRHHALQHIDFSDEARFGLVCQQIVGCRFIETTQLPFAVNYDAAQLAQLFDQPPFCLFKTAEATLAKSGGVSPFVNLPRSVLLGVDTPRLLAHVCFPFMVIGRPFR